MARFFHLIFLPFISISLIHADLYGGMSPSSSTEDDEETTDVDETVKQNVQYVLYIDTKLVYKLEIAREVDGEMVYSKYTEPVKLSSTEVASASGLLAAEVIGTNLYIMATADGNSYLHTIDLTVDEDATLSKATLVGVKE